MKPFFISDFKPYELDSPSKKKLFDERINDLTRHHYENCSGYHGILDALGFDPYTQFSYENVPMLPVRLFKEIEMKSIADHEVFKIMTSSGTSGQSPSKIYLDKTTAQAQQNSGVKITAGFLKSKRMPLIIIDSPSVIKSRSSYSARGAACLFYSLFASDRLWALDDEMRLDIQGLEDFLSKHVGEDILIFGFTFMVWQHLYLPIIESKHRIDLSKGTLIHAGGWKKLIGANISKHDFKKALQNSVGITKVHDSYGMAEQSGTTAFECEYEHLHVSVYSDIITRRAIDLSVCDYGETGIIQVISLLPFSYPGHSLLTEDEGAILGCDTCPCGRLGKYFNIKGRIKDAELRGCSDTYAASFV